MYYLQSRYYNPNVGRFVNGDEVIYTFISKDASGYNTFAYCNNDCVNLKDKTGHAYVIDDALVTCVGAIIIACVIMLFVSLVEYVSTPEFRRSWADFCTAVGNGFTWVGNEIGKSIAKLKRLLQIYYALIISLAIFCAATLSDAKIKKR